MTIKIKVKIEKLKDTPVVETALSQIYEDLIKELENMKNKGRRKAEIAIRLK